MLPWARMLSSSTVAIRFDTTAMGATYIVGVYFLVKFQICNNLLRTGTASRQNEPDEYS